MIYPYSVNKINQNIFLRVFTEYVNLETYYSSWFQIIRNSDFPVKTLSVITDYTYCKILFDYDEYPVLANFLKTELCLFEKLRFAVVVNSEENHIKLEMWKTELILHWIYIHAKVCTDYNCALDYIGLNGSRLF
jgi:hypothetical protein